MADTYKVLEVDPNNKGYTNSLEERLNKFDEAGYEVIGTLPDYKGTRSGIILKRKTVMNYSDEKTPSTKKHDPLDDEPFIPLTGITL